MRSVELIIGSGQPVAPDTLRGGGPPERTEIRCW